MWHFLTWNFLFLLLTPTSQWWVHLALSKAVSGVAWLNLQSESHLRPMGSWLGYLPSLASVPMGISGVLIPSHYQAGRTKWDKLHNALGTDGCSIDMSSLPLPNASWLAKHIRQKRKLCSSFSRQLVTQTSQAFYKQCWLIFATADVYITCQFSSWVEFMTTE